MKQSQPLQHTTPELRLDEETIKAMETTSLPDTKERLLKFLGICSYYSKRISNFTKIIRPLCRLASESKGKLCHTIVTINAFENIKSQFLKSHMLQYPEFKTVKNREPNLHQLSSVTNGIDTNVWIKAYFSCNSFKGIYRFLNDGNKPRKHTNFERSNVSSFFMFNKLLYFSAKDGSKLLCVPESLRKFIISQAHNNILPGDFKNLCAKLLYHFYWPNMMADIEKFTNVRMESLFNCKFCNLISSLHPSIISPVVTRKWDTENVNLENLSLTNRLYVKILKDLKRRLCQNNDLDINDLLLSISRDMHSNSNFGLFGANCSLNNWGSGSNNIWKRMYDKTSTTNNNYF